MSLAPAIAVAVAAGAVRCVYLVRFDFVSVTKRVWTGFGALTTTDAAVWEGMGDIGRIEGLSASINGSAPAGRLVASGVSPDLIATARGEASEYVGRTVQIFLQLFDAQLQVAGAPVPLALRMMTTLEISRDQDSRTIAINHESPYADTRNRPPAGWYSDRDQQKRFPGDRGMERVSTLLFKQEAFPDY